MTEVVEGACFECSHCDCGSQLALLSLEDSGALCSHEEIPGLRSLMTHDSGEGDDDVSRPAVTGSLISHKLDLLDFGRCCENDDCPSCEYGWHKNCRFGCTLKF